MNIKLFPGALLTIDTPMYLSLAAQPLAVKTEGLVTRRRILMLCTWNAILYQRPYESQGKECIISKVQKHDAAYLYCLGCRSDLSTTLKGRRDIGVNSLATPEPIDTS